MVRLTAADLIAESAQAAAPGGMNAEGAFLDEIDSKLAAVERILDKVQNLGQNPMLMQALGNRLGSFQQRTAQVAVPQPAQAPGPQPVDKKAQAINYFQDIKGILQQVQLTLGDLTLSQTLIQMEDKKEVVLALIEGRL